MGNASEVADGVAKLDKAFKAYRQAVLGNGVGDAMLMGLTDEDPAGIGEKQRNFLVRKFCLSRPALGLLAHFPPVQVADFP
jgi:hypothetical protein